MVRFPSGACSPSASNFIATMLTVYLDRLSSRIKLYVTASTASPEWCRFGDNAHHDDSIPRLNCALHGNNIRSQSSRFHQTHHSSASHTVLLQPLLSASVTSQPASQQCTRDMDVPRLLGCPIRSRQLIARSLSVALSLQDLCNQTPIYPPEVGVVHVDCTQPP